MRSAGGQRETKPAPLGMTSLPFSGGSNDALQTGRRWRPHGDQLPCQSPSRQDVDEHGQIGAKREKNHDENGGRKALVDLV